MIADAVGYYTDHNHDDRYYTQQQLDAKHAELEQLQADHAELETALAAVDAKFTEMHAAFVWFKSFDQSRHDDLNQLIYKTLRTNRGQIMYALIDADAANAPLNTYHLTGPLGTSNPNHPASVRRTSTGVYNVDFTYPIPEGSTIQVAPYGGAPRTCAVGGWNGSTVTVRCFDLNASPANAPFTILVVS